MKTVTARILLTLSIVQFATALTNAEVLTPGNGAGWIVDANFWNLSPLTQQTTIEMRERLMATGTYDIQSAFAWDDLFATGHSGLGDDFLAGTVFSSFDGFFWYHVHGNPAVVAGEPAGLLSFEWFLDETERNYRYNELIRDWQDLPPNSPSSFFIPTTTDQWEGHSETTYGIAYVASQSGFFSLFAMGNDAIMFLQACELSNTFDWTSVGVQTWFDYGTTEFSNDMLADIGLIINRMTGSALTPDPASWGTRTAEGAATNTYTHRVNVNGNRDLVLFPKLIGVEPAVTIGLPYSGGDLAWHFDAPVELRDPLTAVTVTDYLNLYGTPYVDWQDDRTIRAVVYPEVSPGYGDVTLHTAQIAATTTSSEPIPILADVNGRDPVGDTDTRLYSFTTAIGESFTAEPYEPAVIQLSWEESEPYHYTNYYIYRADSCYGPYKLLLTLYQQAGVTDYNILDGNDHQDPGTSEWWGTVEEDYIGPGYTHNYYYMIRTDLGEKRFSQSWPCSPDFPVTCAYAPLIPSTPPPVPIDLSASGHASQSVAGAMDVTISWINPQPGTGEFAHVFRSRLQPLGCWQDVIVHVGTVDEGANGVSQTVDYGVPLQWPYYYWVVAGNASGCAERSAQVLAILNPVSVPETLSHDLTVWPNPSSGPVSFGLSSDGQRRLSLKIFDVAGRLVRTVHDGLVPTGPSTWRWDGRTTAGDISVPGVYFVRLQMESSAQTRKVTLVQ